MVCPDQHRDLAAASRRIDEITCSTIHGFCQRLIKPYPAEADIDPGATVMDRNQADLSFLEIVDGWLRERLSGEQGGISGRDGAAQPRRRPWRSSIRSPIICAAAAHCSVAARPSPPLEQVI